VQGVPGAKDLDHYASSFCGSKIRRRRSRNRLIKE